MFFFFFVVVVVVVFLLLFFIKFLLESNELYSKLTDSKLYINKNSEGPVSYNPLLSFNILHCAVILSVDSESLIQRLDWTG